MRNWSDEFWAFCHAAGGIEAFHSEEDCFQMAKQYDREAAIYRVGSLTRAEAVIAHEVEAHAETQAALRAFIADLDKSNAALILAREALAKIIQMDRLHGLTPGSRGRHVWHNGRSGAVALAALDAINKLEVR